MQQRHALIASIMLGIMMSAAPLGAYARVSIDIDIAPPAPRVVAVPPPRRGYVWAPGYWRWEGHQHVWVEGRWMRERRHQHWVPEHWEQRHGRWHFEPGHWERG